MTKKEILTTLSVVEKHHLQEAVGKLEKEGVPKNRGSYLYDAVDPETGNMYPPQFLLETAYKIASGKKLPKGFFDTIKLNSPHFERIRALGYTIVAKWHDDLDLSSKVWSYKWLYTLSTNQWNKVLDVGKLILDSLDLKEDDSKMVISFRDDNKQRMAIIIGSKYVGGFYIEKGAIYVRFFVNEDFDISADSRLSPDEFEFANKIGKLVYMKLDDWRGEQDPLCDRILNDIAHYYEIAPKTNFKRNHLPFMTGVIRSQDPRRRFLQFIRQNPQERLIDIYKYYLKTTGNKDELYKWEIGKQFKDNWDLQATDFGAMLSSVKFANLLSQQSVGFYNLARKNPDDAREYYSHLFDETVPIKSRIQWAKSAGDDLIKKWHPKWTTSGGDERTLSVLWAFNDLAKHAPYKSSFYSKYCDLIDVESASPGDKYEHYLQLLDDLILNYIVKDEELLKLHNETIDSTQHIEDPNYHLLAQNMLYRVLDGYWVWGNESEECNYWIFQGNPKRYDFKSAIENDALDKWTVSAHKDKIQVGDKVILWITGSEAGCFALGEITKEPFEDDEPKDEFWKDEDTSEWKIGLSITHNFVGHPILKERVNADEILSKMNVGLQGSNFSATKEQYERLLSMTEETINYKQAFENWLRLSNAESSNMASSYMRAMELLDGVLEYSIFETSNIQELEELYNDLIDKQRDPEEKYYAAGAPSYGKNGYYSAAINKYIVFHEQLKNSTRMSQNKKHPLNQILYGPPGTGKTYNTITKALEIINDDEVNSLEWSDRNKVKALFDTKLQDGQIVFTTFHQSMSYEDFIEGIKPKIYEDEEVDLNYEIQSGIFKSICKKAEIELGSIEDLNNFDAAWGDLIEHIKNNLKENKLTKIGSWEYSLSSKESLKYSSLNTPSKYNFTITKQNVYDAYQNKKARPSGAFQKDMEDVVDYLKTKFNLNYYQEKEIVNNNGQNFVLIIDEINRGNVSAIFGELITLIENDKRLGMPNEIKVTLPYSKEKFGVPPNLYIIGTMNTADRSVEALDTALRRRFSFTEMPPLYDLPELTYNYAGFQAKDILKNINQRIEKLLDRDHLIGHSYFLKNAEQDVEEKLMDSFYRNIIPLLQEYFYGDYAKIGAVLGDGFVYKSDEKDTVIFAEGFSDEDYNDKAIYQIIDYRPAQPGNQYAQADMTFEEAIKRLMPKQPRTEANV